MSGWRTLTTQHGPGSILAGEAVAVLPMPYVHRPERVARVRVLMRGGGEVVVEREGDVRALLDEVRREVSGGQEVNR